MAKNDLMHGNTSLLVLSLIEQRDMYGYQIIKELKRKSENVDNFVRTDVLKRISNGEK